MIIEHQIDFEKLVTCTTFGGGSRGGGGTFPFEKWREKNEKNCILNMSKDKG